jgi:hypothetical protein
MPKTIHTSSEIQKTFPKNDGKNVGLRRYPGHSHVSSASSFSQGALSIHTLPPSLLRSGIISIRIAAREGRSFFAWNKSFDPFSNHYGLGTPLAINSVSCSRVPRCLREQWSILLVLFLGEILNDMWKIDIPGLMCFMMPSFACGSETKVGEEKVHVFALSRNKDALRLDIQVVHVMRMTMKTHLIGSSSRKNVILLITEWRSPAH